jgi:hypothetical protein
MMNSNLRKEMDDQERLDTWIHRVGLVNCSLHSQLCLESKTKEGRVVGGFISIRRGLVKETLMVEGSREGLMTSSPPL